MESPPNQLWMLLLKSERAWAYAMELDLLTRSHPRKRVQMEKRIKRASLYASKFEQTARETTPDLTLGLQILCYRLWIDVHMFVRLKNWRELANMLDQALEAFDLLSKVKQLEKQKSIVEEKLGELRQVHRHCALQLDPREHQLFKALEQFRQLQIQDNDQLELKWMGRKIFIRDSEQCGLIRKLEKATGPEWLEIASQLRELGPGPEVCAYLDWQESNAQIAKYLVLLHNNRIEQVFEDSCNSKQRHHVLWLNKSGISKLLKCLRKCQSMDAFRNDVIYQRAMENRLQHLLVAKDLVAFLKLFYAPNASKQVHPMHSIRDRLAVLDKDWDLYRETFQSLNVSELESRFSSTLATATEKFLAKYDTPSPSPVEPAKDRPSGLGSMIKHWWSTRSFY